MGTVEPTPEQLAALVAASQEPGADQRPIMMLNLLRFAATADYPDGFDAEPCSGAEAYGRYAAAVTPFLERAGARPIWGAPAHGTVIGPEEEAWDVAFGVRYPSRAAFIGMVTDPEYLEIAPHRAAALADSRLIICDEPGEGGPVVPRPG